MGRRRRFDLKEGIDRRHTTSLALSDIYSSFTQTDSFAARLFKPIKNCPTTGSFLLLRYILPLRCVASVALPFSRPSSPHASSLILPFSSSTRRSLELSTGSPCNCWVRETGASSRRCFTQPHLLLPSPSYSSSYNLTVEDFTPSFTASPPFLHLRNLKSTERSSVHHQS